MSTETLNPTAADALRRLELAFAPVLVSNFDHYGTLWGKSTGAEAETEIAQERAEGATVEEWEITDRDGQPLRIVRVVHPELGIDIRVFTPASVDPAARLETVRSECRRLSEAAVTTADYDRLLCLQDELAFCCCQVEALGAVA